MLKFKVMRKYGNFKVQQRPMNVKNIICQCLGMLCIVCFKLELVQIAVWGVLFTHN